MVSASQGTAHLLATLVLVQAIIAGRSDRPFGSWDIGVHEILGNSVFDVALVGLVLAVVARQGRASIVCAAALILVTAQADSATPGEPAPGGGVAHPQRRGHLRPRRRQHHRHTSVLSRQPARWSPPARKAVFRGRRDQAP